MSSLRDLFATGVLLLAMQTYSAPPDVTAASLEKTQGLAPNNTTSNPGLSNQISFAQWKAACDRLPSNRALRGRLPPRDLLPLPRFEDFEQVLAAFFAQCKTGSLAQTHCWTGKQPATNQ